MNKPTPQSKLESSTIRVCEIYESLQGEGLLVGTPSIFIRTSGCNLRCWFCDTPFASWNPEGDFLTVEQICEQTQVFHAQHCVITGGEPLIFGLMEQLTKQLAQAGHHITIETAGTLRQRVHCDLMSISPKLSGSTPQNASPRWQLAHEERRENFETIEYLLDRHEYQLKFVVDNQSDAEEVLRYLERLEARVARQLERERLLIMPQGTDPSKLEQQAAWLIPWCTHHDLRFCPRSHITWFGNQRGT